jgi:hypothetical protein
MARRRRRQEIEQIASNGMYLLHASRLNRKSNLSRPLIRLLPQCSDFHQSRFRDKPSLYAFDVTPLPSSNGNIGFLKWQFHKRTSQDRHYASWKFITKSSVLHGSETNEATNKSSVYEKLNMEVRKYDRLHRRIISCRGLIRWTWWTWNVARHVISGV